VGDFLVQAPYSFSGYKLMSKRHMGCGYTQLSLSRGSFWKSD